MLDPALESVHRQRPLDVVEPAMIREPAQRVANIFDPADANNRPVLVVPGADRREQEPCRINLGPAAVERRQLRRPLAEHRDHDQVQHQILAVVRGLRRGFQQQVALPAVGGPECGVCSRCVSSHVACISLVLLAL